MGVTLHVCEPLVGSHSDGCSSTAVLLYPAAHGCFPSKDLSLFISWTNHVLLVSCCLSVTESAHDDHTARVLLTSTLLLRGLPLSECGRKCVALQLRTSRRPQ